MRPGSNTPPEGDYVLVTAAHNEEAYIASAVESIAAQTVPPRRWVIVSDASSDGTEDIIGKYMESLGFIDLVSLQRDASRNFRSQVYAILEGVRKLQETPFSFIGNLDADIILEPDYYERILKRFRMNPRLGLAGGFVYEWRKNAYRSRNFNRVHSVPHAVQLFRRECYETFGGYIPLKYGGPDWHAEVTVRMKGWEARCFPEIPVYHQRPTGSVEGAARAYLRLGRMDYSLGSHPVFELFKCIIRYREPPFIIGSLLRMAGFLWLSLIREERQVTAEFVRFIRREQMRRLRSLEFRGKKKAD
ncbi:MAG: glycosyltransferase family 2 protein [Syntrophales bacterium]|nr:glycosyltransferase family 2 protein [Syntrophales bacterium]